MKTNTRPLAVYGHSCLRFFCGVFLALPWLAFSVAPAQAANALGTAALLVGPADVAARPATTVVPSRMSDPKGVAVDGAGNVYMADSGNNAIKKWTAANGSVFLRLLYK